MNEVYCYSVQCKCAWMKVCGERGRSALFVDCLYMPTDSSSVTVEDIVVMIGSRKMYWALERMKQLYY